MVAGRATAARLLSTTWIVVAWRTCLADTTTSCSVGTVEDECVSASENEFFFCTDRYSWVWSEDVQQLPNQTSDSLCLTMDSNVVPGLNQTELLIIGGCNAEFQTHEEGCTSLSNTTYVYNPPLDRFEQRQDIPTERFRAAAVNVSEHIYLFGGRDVGGNLTCSVDRYNVVTGEWTELNVTQEEHCYSDHAGVAGDDGVIYLFGGYTQVYEAMDTVVKVVVSGDDMEFSTTSPMLTRRGDHSCIRLPETDDVFCIGGFTENDWNFSVLNSVERFDLSTEEWEARENMTIARGDFAIGLLNDRITIVGGEDDTGAIGDVEWYDPDADCWTDSGELFDLPYERLRYCAATLQSDNRIYIFGGQAFNESLGDTGYSVEDTVNWYQEVLVDELVASAATAVGPHSATVALATAAYFLTALSLVFGG